MALGGNRLATKYLNPDLCYAAWVTGGSISRAQRKLASKGIIHPGTGGPPSRMGIHYAAKNSVYYQEFIERRVRDTSISQTPTKAEYAEAQTLFDQLIQVEVKRTHELYQSYNEDDEQ